MNWFYYNHLVKDNNPYGHVQEVYVSESTLTKVPLKQGKRTWTQENHRTVRRDF